MPALFMDSKRLWYRAIELEDVDTLARWINDERVRKYLDHRVFPINVAAEEDWIRRVTQPVPGTPSEVTFIFGLKDQDVPIGTLGLMGIHWISREAELRIMI